MSELYAIKNKSTGDYELVNKHIKGCISILEVRPDSKVVAIDKKSARILFIVFNDNEELGQIIADVGLKDSKELEKLIRYRSKCFARDNNDELYEYNLITNEFKKVKLYKLLLCLYNSKERKVYTKVLTVNIIDAFEYIKYDNIQIIKVPIEDNGIAYKICGNGIIYVLLKDILNDLISIYSSFCIKYNISEGFNNKNIININTSSSAKFMVKEPGLNFGFYDKYVEAKEISIVTNNKEIYIYLDNKAILINKENKNAI